MTPLRLRTHVCGLKGIASLAFSLTLATVSAVGQTSVTTYHNDNYRTGWNSTETALTPSTVSASTFGLLAKVTIDDQVDAIPLIVTGVNITAGSNQGTHDVAYVASENDTVYAIDATAGTVLLTQSLGKPVFAPLGCNNNGPHVGINSTPVIDSSSNTLYVVAYTQDKSGPAYRMHALDLGSLADKMPPVIITASHTLSDGSSFNFNASYQRQRPGLLLANGNVYAGFGSFCDYHANQSRGWVLGWNAATLAPFSTNQVTDSLATSPNSFFLSSVWMSGYGLAADDSGNVLFVTGNSDYSGGTYNGVTNIQESAIKVSANLTSVVDLFTPMNQSSLDQSDGDFGSGGLLVLPDQPGATPHMAVAAGKDGNMYLMNEDHLGGYSPQTNNVLGTYNVGAACWCGQSYYVDPDGTSRVVTSMGSQVLVWKVLTSPKPGLTQVTHSPSLSTGQDPGFFTSVSSNGSKTPIVWVLTRPLSQSNNGISLYAMNPDGGGNAMKLLFHANAGAWPNYAGNSNQVPVVANGKVYVASNKQLQIFGLKSQKKSK